jgi:hypothetical protein
MKTAMQELIEKLSMKSGDSFHALAFYHDNDEIIKEALEKEKEQIMNAFSRGLGTELGLDWEDSEQYYERIYNQTYNQNK